MRIVIHLVIETRRAGARMFIRPKMYTLAILVLGIGSLLFLGCSGEKSSSNAESPESIEQSTPLDRLQQGQPGETIVFTEAEYQGTLRVPAGVNIEGIEGSEIVIRPAEGEPGIILSGTGDSNVAHMRVENATGVGILIEERTVRLTNVEVSGTVVGTTQLGHGIRVSDAPSFHAESVSSSNNAGSGLRVEDTETVSIVHPNYLVKGADFEQTASRVIVHPNYLPTIEDKGIVHPNYEPEDGDEVAIVHPNYLPEDEFIIIVHPNYLSGNVFSENSGDGISIVHPNYNPSNDTSLNTVKIVGTSMNNNSNSGLSLENIGTALMSGVVIQNNNGTEEAAGITVSQSHLSMHSTYIGGNSGTGILAMESALALGNKSDSTHTLRGSDEDGLSIVHPNYYPANSVENNGGGGILLGDLSTNSAGKADGIFGNAVSIHSALIQNNIGFGLEAQCVNLQISNTWIRGTQTAEGNGTATGTGLMIDRKPLCAGGEASQVSIDHQSIIEENEGVGIRLQLGATVICEGLVGKNLGGGILADGENTHIKVQKGSCDEEEDGETLCWPPVVTENTFVGIGLFNNANAVIAEALISNTLHGDMENGGNAQLEIVGLGDGLIAVDPVSLSIFNTTFEKNARAGAIVWTRIDAQSQLPDVVVKDSSFSESPYGFVQLMNESATDILYSVDLSAAMPDYWNGMKATCSTDGVSHEWIPNGCLPIPNLTCDGFSQGCSLLTPCGECSLECEEGSICDMVQCQCPKDAECCTHAQCAALDSDPMDCFDWYCSKNLQCEESIEPIENCVSVGENPCETNDDCPDDGLDCTEETCVLQLCQSKIIPGKCAIPNQEGFLFCFEDMDPNPINSCQICVPTETTSAWWFATGYPCDDGDLCTHSDECKDTSSCEGTALICDDFNPCTDDICIGTQGCLFPPNQGPCDDGNPCTFETCNTSDGGSCVAEPIECDNSDDSPCLTNQCNSAGGCLLTPKEEGSSCNDDDNCTGPGACANGTCTNQSTIDCDDGNSCTLDECVSELGQTCINTPLLSLMMDVPACEDGDLCTENTVCVWAIPEGTSCGGDFLTQKVCELSDTTDPCSAVFCDPEFGCVETNLEGCCLDESDCTGVVEDAYACTQTTCSENNECVPNNAIDTECDDGVVCTQQYCKPESNTADSQGCIYILNDDDCVDGNACNLPTCTANGCTYTIVLCEDDNGCTDDSCEPDSGCVNTDQTLEVCVPNNACETSVCESQDNTSIQCSFGALDCDDNNKCTTDSCDPVVGCVNVPSIFCDDEIECTTESCDTGTGLCAKTIDNALCDDGISCTFDVCDASLGCVHTPIVEACSPDETCDLDVGCVSGTLGCADNDLCDDGNLCTVSDVCGNGICAGVNITCDDGNNCTIDSCDQAIGCVVTPSNDNCSDGISCTDDVCDQDDGCVFTPSDDNCSDGILCTLDICTPEFDCVITPVDVACNDDISCTQDICDQLNGCVFTPSDDACDAGETCDLDVGCVSGTLGCADNDLCDDGNLCTVSDVCGNGICAGVNITCDDGNNCTDDICDLEDGCLFEVNDNCDDGIDCTDDTCGDGVGDGIGSGSGCFNAVNDDNCPDGEVCGSGGCAPASPECTVDADCDDGVDCTLDECNVSSGECEYPVDPAFCDDGNNCTIDSCDVSTGCLFEQDDTFCDDGLSCTTDVCDEFTGCSNDSFCNGDESCTDAGCVADECATDTDCDDGVDCTDDSCETPSDSENICVNEPNAGNCGGFASCTPAGCTCTVDSDCGAPTEPCKIAKCSSADSGGTKTCQNENAPIATYCDSDSSTSCEYGSCGAFGTCNNTGTSTMDNLCTSTTGCALEEFINDAIESSQGGIGSGSICYTSWCDWKNEFAITGFPMHCPTSDTSLTCAQSVTTFDPTADTSSCTYCPSYISAVSSCGLNGD